MKKAIKFLFTERNHKKFIVNKDKGITTCILRGSIELPFDVLPPPKAANMIFKKIGMKGSEFYNIMEISATTKLKDGDKYDEIKGKRIAESKAKKKLYMLIQRLALAMAAYYQDKWLSMIDTKVTYGVMINRELNHIKALDYNTKN